MEIKNTPMEFRIAPFEVDGWGYYILYPSETLRPRLRLDRLYLILDEAGRPVDTSAVGHGMYPVTREFIERVKSRAFHTWLADAGEPLEERLELIDISALEQGGWWYWLALMGPRKEDAILPTTRVWFPDGLPAALYKREQATGDLYDAMRLLAVLVYEGKAEILSPRAAAPLGGTVVTAIELSDEIQARNRSRRRRRRYNARGEGLVKK